MGKLIVREGYSSPIGLIETEIAIKRLKDFFEQSLARQLNLTRVSAPLFVWPESGLNDDLSGSERKVTFGVREIGERQCEVVQSLAKWKRSALRRYGFAPGTGLYTDMNAIRRDDETDNLHSIYVDQWDWERIIAPQERTLEFLYQIVRDIYRVLLEAEDYIGTKYPCFSPKLPANITFITAQELLDRYPDLDAKAREDAFVREHKAVFISQIGGALTNGQSHDGRAPDYDDWALNGDILLYHPRLDCALEMSSMGVRVDAASLRRQLDLAGCGERAGMPYHKDVLEGRLPLTIGGGIGQSRLCMYFLEKLHIGEVQVSVWPDEMARACCKAGIELL